MTPVMYARLKAAEDFAMRAITGGHGAKDIIAALVADHRAYFRRGDPNILRVAGVTASCSYSDGDVLLSRWCGSATKLLLVEAVHG